jgi:hypothetical protein
MSTLEQAIPIILEDEKIQELCENLLLKPNPLGDGIANAKDAIVKIMGNYYHSRFHSPQLFSDQHFKKVKNLYNGKDDKIYLELHRNMFVELLRNVLFYDLCSSMKFKPKAEFSSKSSICKKLLSKQMRICGRIKYEIKTDTTENDLFAFILNSISSEQVDFLNFSDRVHELARSLAFDQSFKMKGHKNYVNSSCIPTENLLIKFFDIYFEVMMEMLDFGKMPESMHKTMMNSSKV